MRELEQGQGIGDIPETWVSRGHIEKEIRPQVWGSNVRTKLLIQANDQQLGDWQGWKKVVKPRSKAERNRQRGWGTDAGPGGAGRAAGI